MYQGSLVALVTPLDEHLEIDYKRLEMLVEWHIAEGTEGIVLGGSTGEGIVLSDEEKENILKTVLKVAKKRIPIIMGTGCSNTRAAVARTKRAKELGADSCLVIVPYYNKPTAQGCFQHFYEISRAGLPLIVYHHPGRTGVKLSAHVLSELVALPNIVGIKDSSGDFNLIEDVLSMCNTTIFCGDDGLTYPLMQKGVQGTISVIGNLIPREWSRFVSACLNKDYDTALLMHKKYQKLNEALLLETNPQEIKYAMSLIGKCSPYLRLPLIMPREETKIAIRQAIQNLSLI
jgi:4-hydroxy-tetrahydrodipicolinate synthase